MINHLRSLLSDRRDALTIAGTSLVFLLVYVVFDLREGGRSSSLTTTRLSTPSFYIDHFGAWFLWGALVLDAILAGASALVIATAIRAFRQRRAGSGAACSVAATALMGFAVFGCPGCMVPLFGTLGVAFFANTLPLFGLEFKLLSLAILVATLVWMVRQPSADGNDGGASIRWA